MVDDAGRGVRVRYSGSGTPETSPGGGGARGLAVRDVVVHYRDDDGTVATAVDGLSLDVTPGEVVALLGPSGAGKSTLWRAVAGLEPLSAGSVTWGGADLAGVPVHRRGFGRMFQDRQLFRHRDVGGNVAFGLARQGVDRAQRRAAVRELLELVGLEGFEHREVSTLSGGERQRVALARSLAPRPRLLLLDEPLSALDRALRERLAGEVRAALVATGTTAVFVTHDHDEAFAVADRIAVMDRARLLQVAEPVELWHRPRSPSCPAPDNRVVQAIAAIDRGRRLPIPRVLPRHAFVATAVVAGHPGHQLLRFGLLDVGEEPLGRSPAQGGGGSPEVIDEHL